MAEMSSEELKKKIRNELLLIAKQVKAGDLTPSQGTALSKIYNSALYAEQLSLQSQNKEQVIQVQEELSEADRKRLDKIARLLSGEAPKPKKRGKGAGKDGNNKA